MRSWRHDLVALAGVAATLLGVSPAAAQSLNGRVLEAATDRRIPSAQVSVLDSAGEIVATAVTDISGSFRVDLGRTGAFTIHATREGYFAAVSQTLNLSQDQSLALDVRLERIPSPEDSVAGEEPVGPLPPLDLLGFYDRARNEEGTFYTRFDIEAMGGATTLLDVLENVPGARTEVERFGRPGFRFRSRYGGGLCTPALIVDNVRVQEAGQPWEERVAVSGIEAIEVYGPGKVPLYLRNLRNTGDRHALGNFVCGLVMVWTDDWNGGRSQRPDRGGGSGRPAASAARGCVVLRRVRAVGSGVSDLAQTQGDTGRRLLVEHYLREGRHLPPTAKTGRAAPGLVASDGRHHHGSL